MYYSKIKNKIPKLLTQNIALLPHQLSSDEKAKHQYYVSHYDVSI